MTASMNSKVSDFPASKAAAAIGASLQLDVGNGGVMVLQTHVPQDIPVTQLNQLLDNLMAAGARQKAKAEVAQMEKNIEVQQKALDDLDFQLKEAEETHLRQLAIVNERMATYVQDRAKVEAQGAEEHARAGKRGGYEPTGARRARIAAIHGQLAKEREALQALEAEKEKAGRGREIARRSCEREIEANRKLIEERKALIAG